MHAAALIVAAGRGERFGSGTPKQYAALAGLPVLRRAIGAFLGHPEIDQVRVVIDRDPCRALCRAATLGLDLPPPVSGGGTRQATRPGLEALAADPPAARADP